MWYIILVTAFTNFLLHATTGLQLGVLFQILLIFTMIFHLRSIMVGGNRGQWQIQKILVGGDFKHKTSKIRMSSQKLRAIFRPKSEIQTIFSPKIRWSPKKKKKKGLHQTRERFFGRNRRFKQFSRPKSGGLQKKKKKKKRSSPKSRAIFLDFGGDLNESGRKIGNSNNFLAQNQVVSKKKRSSPKFRAIFWPDSLRLGWWGGCISTWSQIIRNRGCFFGQNRYF